MLNAAIKACPVFTGKLKSSTLQVECMPGVKKVVQVGDNAVAVVADTWWAAKTALDALPIEWDNGQHGNLSSEQIAEMLKEGSRPEQAFRRQPGRRREEGDRRGRQGGRGDLTPCPYSTTPPWSP
jgi:isoquinoline 1-oxidoreductase beta subunit